MDKNKANYSSVTINNVLCLYSDHELFTAIARLYTCTIVDGV